MKREPTEAPEPEWLERSLDRWYAWGLAWMGALLLAFPIYKLREPSLRAAAQAEQRASYVKVGAQLFAQHCSACHGPEGTGGGIAPTLHSAQFLEATADAQMAWLVAGGVPGTAMSAYGIDVGGPLTGQQVLQLVTYMRNWTDGAPKVAGWRAGERAVLVAVTPPSSHETPRAEEHLHHAPRQDEHTRADERDARGERHDAAPASAPGPAHSVAAAPIAQPSASREAIETFRAYCAACHGANGQGGVGTALATPAYRASASEARIRERISAGSPGTAMIAWSSARGGPLTPAQVDAIVALIRGGGLAP